MLKKGFVSGLLVAFAIAGTVSATAAPLPDENGIAGTEAAKADTPVGKQTLGEQGTTPSGQVTALPVQGDTPQAPPEVEVPGPTAEEIRAAQLDSRKIVINLASRSLALYEGDKKVRLYPIGPGKASTPTPVGYYKIRTKEINPTWIDPSDPEYAIPSGDSNPLGYRWMQIKGNYGIHGTNNPDSIGKYVSNGCIRMQEKDVEELFELVKIGTPVEITYNRIVVEKNPDGIVAYYIYPDGYYCQDVDVDLVNKWLSGYGVDNFEADESILRKINASDGEPTYLGKVYGVMWQGNKISSKAVLRDGVFYLPAMELAETMGMDIGWDEGKSALSTDYGEAAGYEKKDLLYLNAADAPALFHVEGILENDGLFHLNPVALPAMDNMGNEEEQRQMRIHEKAGAEAGDSTTLRPRAMGREIMGEGDPVSAEMPAESTATDGSEEMKGKEERRNLP